MLDAEGVDQLRIDQQKQSAYAVENQKHNLNESTMFDIQDSSQWHEPVTPITQRNTF